MDASRNGNFTSSECVALTSKPTDKAAKEGAVFGKAGLTYISECNMERRLGRSLDSETNARPMNWGKLVEKRVFQLLGIDYKECSVETIVHPRYSFWLGSPDGEKFAEENSTVEVKCPYTLKSFCQFMDAIESVVPGKESDPLVLGHWQMKQIREQHTDGEKYYWQVVSNSILLNTKYAELIIYMPYKSELDDIRILASNMPVADLSKYYGLANSTDEELPYLIEGKGYKNLNIVRFEVPQADKDLLTERILLASKSLITV